jgi:hypothetical protein
MTTSAKTLIFLLFFFCFSSCNHRLDAQKIVDQAIEAHGGERYQRFNLSFDFRGRHYSAKRDNGLFTYERAFSDSTGQVRDVLSNEGFYREVNGKKVALTEKQRKAFTASVNSVIYFILLPFGLNDEAVLKKYVGEAALEDRSYHKIQVNFRQEGGGADYTDTFVYWIDKERHTVDYLAYTNEGLRFRKAVNPRFIKGIRFTDYLNYESKLFPDAPVSSLDSLYSAGKLNKLSEIINENIQLSVNSE